MNGDVGVAQLHLAPLLLFVPLVWWWWSARETSRERRLAASVGRRLGPLLGAPIAESRRLPFARSRALLRVSFAVALGLAVLAALGPRVGTGREQDRPPALDLVVCLDVSRSMLARDEAPNRLAAAKAAVHTLLEELPEGRVALVLFAGEARLATPLTRDREALRALLEAADPLSVELGGSDVGAALEGAHKALRDAGPGRGTVLLLGDGEDLAGSGDGAAARLAEAGHGLFALGFGSPRGARVPVALDGGGEAFLEDTSGQAVLTRADPAALERWAALGAGAAGAGDVRAFARAHLVPRAEAAERADDEARRPDRYTWPLAIAWLLWLLELGLGSRGVAPAVRTPRKRATLALGAVGFVAFAGLLGTWADALERHRSGDTRGAAADLAALVEAQGEEVQSALLHDAALVALRAEQPELAASAASALLQRNKPEFQSTAATLLGAAEYGAAQNLAALAREPSSPPNFLANALERARAAQVQLSQAVLLGADADADRRNAERAWRLVRELETLERERAAEAPSEDAPPEPPPEPPPQEQEEEESKETPPPEPEERTLTRAELDQLFERLAAKELEKEAARATARGLRSANVDKDW